MPVVLVGTKSDLKRASNVNMKSPLQRSSSFNEPTQYYEVSTLNFENFEKPFRWLARRLVGQPKLEFVADLAPDPVLPDFNDEMVHKNKLLLQTALKIQVPNEITHEITDELPGKTGSGPATPAPKGEAGISLFNFQPTSSDPNRVFWPSDRLLGTSASGEALPSASSIFSNSEAASQQTSFGNLFGGTSGGIQELPPNKIGEASSGVEKPSIFSGFGKPSIFSGSGEMSNSSGPSMFGSGLFGGSNNSGPSMFGSGTLGGSNSSGPSMFGSGTFGGSNSSGPSMFGSGTFGGSNSSGPSMFGSGAFGGGSGVFNFKEDSSR